MRITPYLDMAMHFSPKHIMVPVAIDPDEDIKLAEFAILTAVDIAQKFSSRITLLHLRPALSAGTGASVDMSGKIYEALLQALEAQKKRGQQKLEELKQSVNDRGIVVETKMVDASASIAHVIVATAEEMAADLLVLSSHGRSGLSKLLFGSVAEKVASSSLIPVLLLHHKGLKAP